MKLNKTLLSSVAAVTIASAFSACGGTTSTSTTTTTSTLTPLCTSAEIINQSVAITSNTTWGNTTDTDKECYAINGKVTVESGATLTIEPGTIVYGVTSSSFLAVKEGAKISAIGNSTSPILFTSANEVAGSTAAQGQWGGLVIAGGAKVNKSSFSFEADSTITAGTSANDTDSSGTLQYVVIKNSGYEVATDKELNGLSLLAVGNGTTIDHVAVINGKDDGIELWGGTVNMTNLYIKNAGDDHLDIDNGYTGTVDGLYIEVGTTASSDPRGIEADSLSSTAAGTPASAPTIKNFIVKTVANNHEGMRFREGIQATLNKGVLYYNGANSKYAINVTDATANSTFSATNVSIVTDKTDIFNHHTTGAAATLSGTGNEVIATTATPASANTPDLSALKTWGDAQ